MSRDDQFVKRLIATFKIEATEHLAAISSGLLELEKGGDPARRAELIERVFREAHSLKGAARTVNITGVEALCQSLENVFSVLRTKASTPRGDLFDLLHKALALAGSLLESRDTQTEASSKAEIKRLVPSIDRAARELDEGTPLEVTEVPSPAPAREVSFAGSPPAAPLSGSTTRVEKAKLDQLLLQAEALLQAKQFTGERSSEVRQILKALEPMEKRWAATRNEIRSIGRALKQGRGATELPRIDERVKSLLDSLESGREGAKGLRSMIAALERKIENDRRSIAVMVDSLVEGTKRISMTPFSTLFSALPSMVRNVLAEQGKEAELIVSGGDVEVDRRVLEEMKDPLTHLVRNCLDHGLEKPGERASKGKPPSGRIIVSASHHESGKVELTVSDDGPGIDIARVKTAAVKLGIISSEDAERLDGERLRTLVFRSGVSTSPLITDLSGRGLGLAIVQEKAERLGGTVACESSPDRGTLFRILLPVSLATARGLMVRVGEHLFVIPAAHVRRTVRTTFSAVKPVEGRDTLSLDGAMVPIVRLSSALELSGGDRRDASGLLYAAVLEVEEKQIAFMVDEVLYEQEFLVKGLGRQLRRVRNVLGATVLGTGKVVPVLNAPDLMKSAVLAVEGVQPVSSPRLEPVARRSLLVVEDSVTARTLLRNIMESAGYDVRTAIDGVDAYALLKEIPVDLVISDVDMPRMNGFDLTARIRADKALADLPVVLVTALDSPTDRERGVDVGANAYIVKGSFDQSNLLEVVKRLI